MNIPILGISTTLNDDPELTGVTLTIFCSGCPHKCEDCQTPMSWDVSNGKLMEIEEIKNKIKKSISLIKSVCFCGGEFLLYEKQLIELGNFCNIQNIKTILYTGYVYEEINSDIIKLMDIIIDGKYMKELKQNSFPASSNQRVWKYGNIINHSDLRINQ